MHGSCNFIDDCFLVADLFFFGRQLNGLSGPNVQPPATQALKAE